MPNQSELNSKNPAVVNDDDFFVVGIGASAGGLKALEELFNNLSSNSGAAFVVIQHLSPDFKSLMKELLERRTIMPVHRVTEGMKLQPNSVYLIPPGQNLALEKNVLHLKKRKQGKNRKRELNFPIDLFLSSLAKNHGQKAIGVILSGSGSDGTRGLQAINEAGGVTLVQDPETAEFDGMPKSAIATGIVNQILPPRELSQLIYQYIVAPTNTLDNDQNQKQLISETNLNSIIQLLLEQEELDFSQYKPSTISRRIYRRCLIHNTESIDSYLKVLKQSPVESKILCSDLLIKVTHFFRDDQAWQNLEHKILPQLIAKTQPITELRFWVTACSTGEEAYSLAILVHEALQNLGRKIYVKIFATDIDKAALKKASQGVYPTSIRTDVSPERLQKYFTRQEASYQIKRQIREMLIFSSHDLTKDASFTRINLVSCRNVLIYMKPDLQYQILRNLHFSLIPQGVLFLGQAETLGKFSREFKVLDKKWKLFQKQRNIKLLPPFKATPKIDRSLNSYFSLDSPRSRLEPILEQCLNRLSNTLDSVILIISQDDNLIHISGDSSKIFKTPEGKVTTEVVNMVIAPLRLPLNTALYQARQQKKPIIYQGIQIKDHDEIVNLRLEVIPAENNWQHDDFLIAKITQEITTETTPTPEVENFELGTETSRRILELETELQQTRENLQTLVEELETINEEQKASNEELTAANEELQSTNEELHSVNEELHTVNIEYQSKIGELIQLNDDVDNLLQSTEIGVVFLDDQLRIRKFTPAVHKAISLRLTDLERPLKELSWKFDCPHLLDLLSEVLVTKQPQELEVKLQESASYLLMQVHLYHTENNDAEGLVLSFIHIDEIKQIQLKLEREIIARQRSEEQLRINQEQLMLTQGRVENVFSSLEDAVWSFDLPDKQLGYINDSFETIYGRSKSEFLANNNIWFEVIHPQDKDLVAEAYQATKQQGKLDLEYRILHPDGSIRRVRDRSKIIYDDFGTAIRQDFVISDITEQKQVQQALKQREQSFQAIFNSMYQFIAVLNPEGVLLEVNQTALTFGGLTAEDVLHYPFWEAQWWKISTETQEELQKAIALAAAGEFIRYEISALDVKNQVIPMDLSLKPIMNELGQVIQIICEGRY